MGRALTDHPSRQRDKLRHGLHAPRLARGLSYCDRMANQFKRGLEDLILARDGDIDLYRAALIHSASEAQRLASANRTERRQAADQKKLTPELGLAFDAAYLKALDLRDRKLESLGLAKTAAESLLTRLYRKRGSQAPAVDGVARSPASPPSGPSPPPTPPVASCEPAQNIHGACAPQDEVQP
jgi:hypothetical protein